MNASRKWQTVGLIGLLLLAVVLVITMRGGPQVTEAVSPYIVQGDSVTAVTRLVAAAGGEVFADLDIIDGVAARLSDTAVADLRANAGIVQITPDTAVQTAMSTAELITVTTGTADYGEVVGANFVHNHATDPVTGTGVTIAIVDTGLDGTLPGINKNTFSPTTRVVGWQDFIEVGNKKAVDPNGHGTHVAGIAASSNQDGSGNYDGVAPDVNLVGVRVLGETGVGTYSSVIQGIDWVVANKDTYSIDIMNLSLVATAQSPYWADPLNQAVMRAWQAGIFVVAAAGNGGPQSMSIGVPGNVPYVLTVGAFTDNFTWDNPPNDWGDDFIPPFSAMGPTLDGFVKPDLIAPGAHMVSTMQSSSFIATNHDAYKVGGTKFSMAGTSQATAVASGTAALVLAKDPTLTPDQVKFRLMRTALLWTNPDGETTPYSVWEQGAGRLNAYDAVYATTTEAANVELDIDTDINDSNGGYEGYTYFDEADGLYKLHDSPVDWPDSYDTWTGGFSAWSGGFSAWSGGFSAWSGGFSAWSGGFSAWSGGFSAWSGGFSAWSGGFSAWSGGFSAWSGGFSAWSGSEPWAGRYDDPLFVASYSAGEPPAADQQNISIDEWQPERDWQNMKVYLPTVIR